MMGKNIHGTIEYDGINYFGWQRQSDKKTIQSELELALSILLRTPIIVKGSSRTDRGVHALGQSFNFKVETDLSLNEIIRKANALLPDDIAVKSLGYVSKDFDARYSAKGKLYEYHIVQKKSPLSRSYSWYIKQPIDYEFLNELSSKIIGTHCFKAFSKGIDKDCDCNCPIYFAKWTKNGNHLKFKIKGAYFLRGMVRSIVGGMVAVSKHKITSEQFIEMLEKGERIYPYQVAPGEGLTLVKVFYR